MLKITWLSSYPKSGNTFVRFLLAHYFHSNIACSADVDRHIPNIHPMLSQGAPLDTSKSEKLMIKTHFRMSAQHPYLQNTIRFIYIIRNPRDVLLSNSRYSGVTNNQPIDTVNFAREFIKCMGVPRWQQMNMGSYPEHVASWLGADWEFPHLLIRYEDLKRNTRKELIRMIRFLDEEPEENRLVRALESSSLDAMRMLEKKEASTGIFGYQGKGNYFVGQGKSGQSLAFLGEDIEQEFVSRFKEVMDLFGYN